MQTGIKKATSGERNVHNINNLQWNEESDL